MLNLFKKIDPEVVRALRWKLPDQLEVDVKPAEEGGFVVTVKTFPGCFTQADTPQELYEMVNDAVFSYLDIPEEYQPFMPAFEPRDERLRSAITTEESVVFQKV